MRFAARILTGLVAILLHDPVLASPRPESAAAGNPVFPANYFAASRPADAYDMVRRVPGFSLIEPDPEVRGFAGARGNVLVDGKAPASKDQDLAELLRRIPAKNVLRIELVRAGSEDLDTGGFDVVANIILASGAAVNSSLESGLVYATRDTPRPSLAAELSRVAGDSRLNVAVSLAHEIDDDSGSGYLVDRNAGLIVGRSSIDELEFQQTMSASADAQRPAFAGELGFNASLAREITSGEVETGRGGMASMATEREVLWRGEGAVRYRKSTGSGAHITAMVLQRLGWLRDNAAEDDERFREVTDTSESIARAEYRGGGERLALNASVEAALNRLSSEAELSVQGEPVSVPGLDVTVSERRAEVSVGAVWKPRADLLIEPSMNAELSSIQASGDARQQLSFRFWKPRLAVNLSGRTNQFRAVIERTVSQLDFRDFVASASLDRDEVTAGATSLRPPQLWAIFATFERRFWDDGALILTARHEWISDAIDRVVVRQGDEVFDAVGNVGAAERQSLRMELAAPMGRLGLNGLQLRASTTLLRSRVTDPVTGRRRMISEDRPFEGQASITHDLPGGRWSWGADATFAHHEHEFRIDQIRREAKGTAFGAFVEFRPRADWRVKIQAQNLLSRVLRERRERFEGPRSENVLNSVEVRRIRTVPIFTMTVRKSFGAASPD